MNNLQITEYKNIRVLTTQQIAEAYGSDTRVISNNFNRNKERYIEGKHYICLEGEELKDFKTNHQFDESSRINKLYLWTEKGAFLHAKSLNTDTAWEVYDRLVDNYFNKKKPMSPVEMMRIQLGIPKGRNVVLPMPKGTKVMPAGQTKELMNMNGVPHFKDGAGVFNIIDYIAHPSKLLQYGLDKFTSFRDAVEPGLSIAKQSISAVKDMALSKVKSLVSGFTTSSGGGYSTSGVEQWRNLAKTALLLTNQYTESNLNALLTQMKHESGGNARAINLWDSNAKRGIPSKGLMQVIDPTFRSYAMAPYNKDIYDPLSNMIASIRYTVSRYGSLYKGWTARGYKGYKNGGMPISGEVYIANENGFGSEYIGRMGNKHVVANNQQITDGIKQAVIEGMMEVYMSTQSNGADSNGTIPYIINAVLKTEDNEVLARAVEKGQASRSSRFNPSPAY